MPGRGRGRGRGRGGRGGGRGRGRGGSRGRSAGRFQRTDGANATPQDSQQKVFNVEEDPRALFTSTAFTQDHLDAQKTNRYRYCASLSVLLSTGVQVTQNARIRALAMAWARGDMELACALLCIRSQFGLVEVLKALNMLDAGRQVRVLEKKLKSIQLSGNKMKPQKLGKLKSDIDNLNKLKPPLGSASGAVCKHIAKWVRGFTSKELEFYAIQYPKEPWKKLADIVHLHPTKDFEEAPWFLPYCFGTGAAPRSSLVEYCQNLSADTVNKVLEEYDIPYSIVKQFKDKLDDNSKRRIAEYETKLDTLIWYYEDIRNPEVDTVILDRLKLGQPVTLPNGKLLERLLTIVLLRNPELAQRRYGTAVQYDGEPEGEVNILTRLIEVAEPRLTSIKLSLESPIVVIGDKSASMEVAIRTSTIIASLLTAICSARLVFFNRDNHEAPFLPKTVKEMLKLAVTVKAEGGTAPAASLYPFYENKEVVKTFIIVTDEEENGNFASYRFAPLYKKYHDEVYPAHLVFVSFLRGQHAQGQMVRELNGMGFYPKQLRLEGNRPDLTKLDDMFGQLSAATESFQEQLATAEAAVRKDGVRKLFEKVKVGEEMNSGET